MLSHAGRRARAEARPSERGETLIEVLIAIVLLGTIMTTVLGGLYSLVLVSDRNQERTQVSVGVQTFAEQLKQPVEDFEYIPCGTAAEYQTLLDGSDIAGSLPDGYTYSVDEVRYLQVPSAAVPVAFGPGCSLTGPDLNSDPPIERDNAGLQQVEITVVNARADEDRVVETLLVVKRDARCPEVPFGLEGYDNKDAGPC